MKKQTFAALTLVLALSLGLLAGCSGKGQEETTPPPDETLPVEETASLPPETGLPEETVPVLEPVETETVTEQPSEKPSPKPSEKPSPKPSEKPAESPSPSPLPTPPAEKENADLAAFYEKLTTDYQLPGSLQLAEEDLLENLYPGLEGVETEQCLVYMNMMSMNNGELALIQVKDSKDVDAVKDILRERIDYMVGDDENPGGAWYPAAVEQWKLNSAVVSCGNYVMMVVNERHADIAADFSAYCA